MAMLTGLQSSGLRRTYSAISLSFSAFSHLSYPRKHTPMAESSSGAHGVSLSYQLPPGKDETIFVLQKLARNATMAPRFLDLRVVRSWLSRPLFVIAKKRAFNTPVWST